MIIGGFCSCVGIAIAKVLGKQKSIEIVTMKEVEQESKYEFPLTQEPILIKDRYRGVFGHEEQYFEPEPSKFMSKPKNNFKRR